jgi:hypothetical protein
MKTNLLSKIKFKETYGEKMINITGKEDEFSPDGVIDIQPYVDSIPSTDLDGNELADMVVEAVYRSSNDKYDHILLITQTKNVFLVIVIDLVADCIHGHHLLNLNKEYGIITEQKH